MKLLPLIVATSLAANGALLAVLLLRPRATPAPPPQTIAVATIPAAANPPRPAPEAAGGLPDFDALRQSLRAAGVGDESIPYVLRWVIRDHFERRRMAAGLRAKPEEYWRTAVTNAYSFTAEQQALGRSLDLEERRALKDLLGPEYMISDGQRSWLQGLPAPKASAFAKLLSDYREMEDQLYADNPDRGAPEVRAKVELLNKEKRADIERLLSADELLVYDLRTSPAAGNARNRLGAFQPTEAEFRGVYELYKGAEQAGLPLRTVMQQAGNGPLEAELRKVLGEDRYAQLLEVNDWQLHQIRELAASLGLPAAAAGDLAALQKTYQSRLAEVSRNRELTANQRDAERAMVATEAREKFRAILGDAGLQKFEQRPGQWIRMALNPRSR